MVDSMQNQNQGMKTCVACNANISEESFFCPYCGKPNSVRTGPPEQSVVRPMTNPIILPPSLQGVIILKPRESINWIWRCSRNRRIIVPGGQRNQIEPGFLIASNQRIIFIKASGLFSKAYSVNEVICYENVGGVSYSDGILNKVISINDQQGGEAKSLKLIALFEVNSVTLEKTKPASLQSIQELLTHFANNRQQEIDEEKKKDRIQYVLDFSFLKKEMEKGGLVVQTIKCPSCSAGISIPAAGNNMKCPYCGSMVYAQDVFDKMKALIGAI